MINMHRMRMLREIVRRGSVTRAAEALYMTPSAVSQQMAVLEREAGVALLERHGRGIRPTDAGALLARHAEDLLADLEAAEADLAAIREGVAGTLRLCAFPTAARALMVPAIVALRDRWPQLTVTMVDLEPEESLPMLTAGDLDLIVEYQHDLTPDPFDPGVERRLLVTETVQLAMPASHPLAGSEVRMSDLAEENWVVGRDASSFLDVVVRAANRAGYEPRVDIHSNDFQVILAAVGSGLGVTLVPPLGLLTDYPAVTLRPLADLELHRRVIAAIRRGSASAPRIAAALSALEQTAQRVAAATPGVEAA